MKQLVISGMIPPIASRFVAGETAAEAIEQTLTVNQEGLGATVNLLGEDYVDRSAVVADTETYLTLVESIKRSDIDASISVKPTQLGLNFGVELFREQLGTIVAAAKEAGVMVWLDMEDSETTEATVAAAEAMGSEYSTGVGVCLQSNLRRTPRDIDRLRSTPVSVRLVKGAYRESPAVAHQNSRQVDEAYRRDLETLFRTWDEGIAVASHDPAMLSYAEQLHDVHGTPFEFQFLMGVRPAAQRELADRHRTVQYIPFGDRWLSYFTRRVLERSENAKFAARAIIGR